MIIHQVPYEWVEKIFGTFVADNFNTISISLSVIGIIIAIICGRRITFSLKRRYRHHVNESIDYEYMPEQKGSQDHEPEHGQISETGWVYDRDTLKWNPPDYLSEESRLKWKWDEEKRIWIDLEKQRRIEKHQAYLASTAGSREPTYEEWKAQRLKEKNDEQHPVQ